MGQGDILQIIVSDLPARLDERAPHCHPLCPVRKSLTLFGFLDMLEVEFLDALTVKAQWRAVLLQRLSVRGEPELLGQSPAMRAVEGKLIYGRRDIPASNVCIVFIAVVPALPAQRTGRRGIRGPKRGG